ncbi:hypothetical protein ERO13_A10G187100v2 [Gossypium hirsutum]|uniref:Sigma factor binding protein 1, chloroplastic n=1 Tax=Gossypium hirsutum TaxID=3635 RepID=A0ABM2YTQ2_GOSHI|nr:sigma factor binding protein 1, chloroplastic-like [Gossypium hirsutum]KAG4180787.1 hypothetical protein ERO13_A10G187100v2 [Gossypium hirsutum]
MDALRVHQMKRSKKSSKRSNSKKDFKVVYISTPVKVETCASQFRALVQELTGKDSDVADRLADYDSSTPDNSPTNSDMTRVAAGDRVNNGQPLLNSSIIGSVFDPFCDEIMSEGSFMGMFTSKLSHGPSQFDVITGFGSV